MNGYQLRFFTQQDRKHAGLPLAQWLLEEARRQGVRGATLMTASEGFGKTGRIHYAHFFELADQPQEVTMAVSEEESERIFEVIRKSSVKLFYVKTPIEFGVTGEGD
jgi:PII-like signaling protein